MEVNRTDILSAPSSPVSLHHLHVAGVTFSHVQKWKNRLKETTTAGRSQIV